MFAPYCEQLIGLEIADIAVERGKERLAHLENVKFVQGALPHDMPEGTFDLIILSDVLVYFPKDVLTELLNAFDAALRPGGKLFCMHYLGNIGAPMPGGTAHQILKQQLALDITFEQTLVNAGPDGQGYDILILEKPAKPQRRSALISPVGLVRNSC